MKILEQFQGFGVLVRKLDAPVQTTTLALWGVDRLVPYALFKRSRDAREFKRQLSKHLPGCRLKVVPVRTTVRFEF